MLKIKLTTFELAFQVHLWLKCCHAREHINDLFMPLITSPKKNRRVKENLQKKHLWLHKKKRRHWLVSFSQSAEEILHLEHKWDMLKTLSPRHWCNQTICFSDSASSAVSTSHHTMWVWGSARCDFCTAELQWENHASILLQKITGDLQWSIAARQSNKTFSVSSSNASCGFKFLPLLMTVSNNFESSLHKNCKI